MKDDDYLEDEIYNNSGVNFVIGERPDGDLLFIADKYPEQFNAMMKELTQWVKRYGIQERKSQLDELIDINSKTFNRWTQTDIANFFLEVGRIYRSLENRLANKEKEQ